VITAPPFWASQPPHQVCRGRNREDGVSVLDCRYPSSSTVSGLIAGAFSSGRMLTRSMKWCVSLRNALTTSGSSTNSPGRRGGPSAPLSRTPNCASRVDHRPICVRCEDMRAGDAAASIASWAARAELPNPIRLSSQAQRMTPFRRFAAGGWVTRRMGEDALKATFKTVTNSQRADRDALFDARMSLAAH
jgi:hypothetical protein